MAKLDKGKARKVLSQAFIDNADTLAEDEALEALFTAEKKVRDLTDEMKLDEDLISATQVVKDLKAGYNSAIQNEKAKIAYLLEKIDELRDENPNTDGVE
jgi:hypothetical protein